MKRITIFAIACVLLVAPAYAAISLNDPGVVGTIEAGTQNSSTDNEVEWANYLLSLGANATVTADGNIPTDGASENYKTGINNYNGTLTGGTQINNSTNVSGYAYVLAKYDGQNAGYVLFNVAAYGNTIPGTSEPIWTNTQGNGYGLSHFTGYGSTSVPDGGMTLMLLGGGLVGLETLRRRLRA